MDVRRRFGFFELVRSTPELWLVPLAWGSLVTMVHELAGAHWISMPWLPTSSVAVAVAFYLGFKNNAAYDRTWEARKVWGAIVNASRSWAWAARDLVDAQAGPRSMDNATRQAVHRELVLRHVAWLDALRHQLRRATPWEHGGGATSGCGSGSPCLSTTRTSPSRGRSISRFPSARRRSSRRIPPRCSWASSPRDWPS